MTSLQPHHLGAKRDERDERDIRFAHEGLAIAPSADLRHLCTTVYDQLALHSCSANATASALTIAAAIAGKSLPPPSRLFVYYNARALAGTENADDGATLRNTIKTIAKTGTCAETLWPYDPAAVNERPVAAAYAAATIHAVQYQRIDQSLDALRACLTQGFPFVFGVDIYSNAMQALQTATTMPLPADGATVVGGHAVAALGYDDATGMFTILNSLGPNWGAHGYFTMPYAYFTNPSWTYDFWTIRSVD
jgi:C1A family cysteine protease